MSGRAIRMARKLAPLALLALLAVGFLWRCNLAGKTMLPADLLLIMEPWRHYQHRFPEFNRISNPILDAVQQFYPWRKFAGESLKSGTIPFWNPYELCGNPFVGNNQSAVFYPEAWLHALMPTHRALGWATSVYFFICGALMYWYLRLLRLRKVASIIGATAFMFNGFVIGWLCFPSFRSVPGWLAGMLVGFELIIGGRRISGIALCAAFGGLQFLAGNLHISLYILIVFGAYVLFRCFWRRENWDAGTPLVWVGATAIALVIGSVLAAAQLLPTLELMQLSARGGGKPYAQLLQFGLSPQLLLTGLMPDIFGNPADYNHWGAQFGDVRRAYTEIAFYVGVLPVLFAPLAFLFRRKLAAFWVAVTAAGALLATGTHLNAVLYYLVPGFDALSGIGRAVVMVSIGLAVLGATGTHALLQLAETEPERLRRWLLGSAGAVGGIAVVGGIWVWMATGAFESAIPGIGDYTLLQIGRFAILAAICICGGVAIIAGRRWVGAALLIACLAADLYIFVDKFTPATNPQYLQIQAHSVQVMKNADGFPRMMSIGKDPIHRMAPNTPMIERLEDIQGSDSLKLGAYQRFLSAISTDRYGFRQPDPLSPAVDLTCARFVHSSFRLPNSDGLELISDTDGFLYKKRSALPRAFTVSDWSAAGPDEALENVCAPDFAPEETVYISGPEKPEVTIKGGAADVSVRRHRANSVTIGGNLQPHQMVVLTDSFYPGWRAYQGGKRLPLMRADYAFRAVHTTNNDTDPLRFLYVPATGWVGMYATLLAIAVIAGLAAMKWCGKGGRAP